MTFRAKPVVKRAHRASWETQDRRNLYLNLGFGLIVVIAVVILADRRGADLLQRPSRVGRLRQRPVDHQGRVQRPPPGRDVASGRGRAADPDRGRRRSPDPGAGRQRAADPRAAAPAAAGHDARAADRLEAPGLTRGRRGRDRHATGRRRAAGGRGDHPRAASRLGHRGRAGHRQRRHRPVRRAEGRRQGQGRAGAQGHPGRQGLGGHRQDRLDRCLDGTAGRRSRLDPGRRHESGRGLPDGALRGPGQHADGGRRGE